MKVVVFLAFLALVAAHRAKAAAQDVTLTGLSGQSLTLTPADIAAMPHVAATLTLDGTTKTCSGVPLTLLLRRVGAPVEKALRGPELADAVIVDSNDGYRVVLALAETDSLFRTDKIILADRCDGAPLPAGVGPYRLVVEGDRRPARAARMVKALTVFRLAARPAP